MQDILPRQDLPPRVPNGTTPRPKLPSAYYRLLTAGDTENEYRGGAGLVGALVGIALQHGVGVEALLQHLRNPRNRAAYDVLRSGRVREANVRAWYERSAAQQLQVFDPVEYRQQLAALRETATLGLWRGRYAVELEPGEVVNVNGSVLRRVLHAHIRLAFANPGIDYPASERAVAKTAHVSRPAAKRATHALVALGVVRRRRAPGKFGRGTAAWYRLETSGKQLEALLEETNAHGAGHLSAFECHAVFRHGNGLRFDVWAHIVAVPGIDVREAAAATGANVRTVRRVFARLEKLGLIVRDHHGAAASSVARDDLEAALDAAAETSGMAQRSERQAQQYEVDRAHHAVTILRAHGSRSRLALRHRRVKLLIANRGRARIDYETGEVLPALGVLSAA